LRLADDAGLSTAIFNLMLDRFSIGGSGICYLDRVEFFERYIAVICSYSYGLEYPHGVQIWSIPCVCRAGTERLRRRTVP
jgi:hypothetical protein